MSRRKKTCASCGLTNFRDASQCQWCALALQDRVRNELVDDRPARSAPWGAALIMLAVAILCGGVVWHLTRKAVVRAEQLAAEAVGQTAPAKPAKRPGPPALGGRSPSDPASAGGDQFNGDYLPMLERGVEPARTYTRDDFITEDEYTRGVLERERAKEREREEWARIMQQQPAARANRSRR